MFLLPLLPAGMLAVIAWLSADWTYIVVDDRGFPKTGWMIDASPTQDIYYLPLYIEPKPAQASAAALPEPCPTCPTATVETEEIEVEDVGHSPGGGGDVLSTMFEPVRPTSSQTDGRMPDYE